MPQTLSDSAEDLPFDLGKLDQLAELAVRTGVNIQPGQELIITAPTEALPLLRRIAVHAYKAGASVVTPIISDGEIARARYEHGAEETFDTSTPWLFEGMAAAYKAGAARMAIAAADPMLLADMDPARVARAGKAMSLAYRPAGQMISNFDINWSIVAYPGRDWARRVFPDLPPEEAQGRLAEAIFAASRITGNDPVQDWAAHNARIHARASWLNDQQFDALHYSGPGTDLTLGLPEGHIWLGGAERAENGVVCNPNIPTEEVFTAPDCRRAEGTVRATKPLAHQGTLIEGIEVRFEGGKIVEAKAEKGEAVFLDLLENDEGARRLGEVALVPHSSPISQSGILFLNTLFDENASCHIALGKCYPNCVKGGVQMSPEAAAAAGMNASIIHVDWMIGSDRVDIDGIRKDGTRVPVMRGGEWA